MVKAVLHIVVAAAPTGAAFAGTGIDDIRRHTVSGTVSGSAEAAAIPREEQDNDPPRIVHPVVSVIPVVIDGIGDIGEIPGGGVGGLEGQRGGNAIVKHGVLSSF